MVLPVEGHKGRIIIKDPFYFLQYSLSLFQIGLGLGYLVLKWMDISLFQ